MVSKTFFRRNPDVLQEKMTQRSAKRPAVRVRWEFSDTPWRSGYDAITEEIGRMEGKYIRLHKPPLNQ